MPESIDALVFEIDKNKKYPELEEGDFIIKTKNNKLKTILRWLSG